MNATLNLTNDKTELIRLVVRAQRGDREAFGELFVRFEKHVLAIALRRIGDYGEAQELTQDVFMSMPPMPFEYEGREVVVGFCANLFAAGRRFDLVPTRANGQPAFGAYLRARTGINHGTGLYVLTLTGDRICAMTRFENSVLPSFGLPRSLSHP